MNLSYHPMQISPALNMPMGLIYLVLPISGLLFCFYAVVEYLTLINSKQEGKEPVNELLKSVPTADKEKR